ncbi:LysR substrate-binding domain-containing protein [Cupriavidus basilensis]|uniref:LysR substrate-binding domain-containing protein n=1 Tax=Cupriavidus basilensis TaxID=68895 RepID=A0ABT6AKQ0_9BURK|nr:LysR substrate-binding domain-containing protein [Cupriavidus basilensis]MDF3833170.1 LysR substrate-binding domain-containing protein [Cupriavidus basilensis]
MHARVLRYLDEVVTRGSIRQAAQHLHVAPSAINRQILDLETELGAPIFERINKRLRLTPLGEMVLAHVRHTLREHALLRSRIEAVKGVRQGEVTVVTTAGLAGSLMPALVHEFRQQYPGILVRLVDLPVAEIVSAVERGDADLGLGYELPDMAAFSTLASNDWHIGAVVAPGHALAGQPSTLLSECLAYPLILPAPSMSIRAILDEAFARAMIDVSPVTETTSTSLMRRLVMLGTGIAFLNPLDVLEERARGALVWVPLRDGRLPCQTLRLVARARNPLSAAAALMADRIGAGLAALFAGAR